MSVSFATSVYVEAPPAVVFAALANIERWKEWLPNFVAIDKLTPGPFGAGTEWRESRKVFGKETTEHFRVTRYEPPSRMDLVIEGSKGTSKRGQYLVTYELVPERSGTNVELTVDIRMPGLWALFSRVVLRPSKQLSHQDLEALKQYLESPWPAGMRR
jgi:carbon monoxide dehydrogenase subunit G